MMTIDILKQKNFTISGSSVLKMMQNQNTPALDLIVRESIQNSLDAVLPNQSFVGVDFFHGTFNIQDFANEYEHIDKAILNKFIQTDANYLAIRDYNTIGLTGNLNGVFDVGEKNQNLGKLVFHIMKAQDAEGAGGSWGIGKTVYYRIGIGLTIYYSRIRLDNGEFQERLVSALVENELTKNGLLKEKNNIGVAFFGNKNQNGDIEAITDANYIHYFLSIFNLKPFVGTQTGTTILIPFVDDEKLLKNNKDTNQINWWESSVEKYLYVSILRWYFPRISSSYPGAKLRSTINGKRVEPDLNTPLFKKFNELYQCAKENTNIHEWINRIPITRTKNVKVQELGTFCYGKVTKEELDIIKHHLPDPYEFLQLNKIIDENNDPIICFTRKPGMIVNYMNSGLPIPNIKCGQDEYIIGIFVLNSNNEINTSSVTINLDEYIRQSEKSDHTSWCDHAISDRGNKILIVQSIEKQIRNALDKTYGNDGITTGQANMENNFAVKFGKLLLPDEDFGTKPTPRNRDKKVDGTLTYHKSKNIIKLVERRFDKDKILLTYEISVFESNSKIMFKNMMNTISLGLDPIQLEEKGINYPFNIEKLVFRCLQYKDSIINEAPVFIDLNSKENVFKNYKIHILKTSKDKCYGFEMTVNPSKEDIRFQLNIELSTTDRLTQTYFDTRMEE